MKVGDEVKVERPGYHLHGQRGVITRAPYDLRQNGTNYGRLVDIRMNNPLYPVEFSLPVSWFTGARDAAVEDLLG